MARWTASPSCSLENSCHFWTMRLMKLVPLKNLPPKQTHFLICFRIFFRIASGHFRNCGPKRPTCKASGLLPDASGWLGVCQET